MRRAQSAGDYFVPDAWACRTDTQHELFNHHHSVLRPHTAYRAKHVYMILGRLSGSSSFFIYRFISKPLEPSALESAEKHFNFNASNAVAKIRCSDCRFARVAHKPAMNYVTSCILIVLATISSWSVVEGQARPGDFLVFTKNETADRVTSDRSTAGWFGVTVTSFPASPVEYRVTYTACMHVPRNGRTMSATTVTIVISSTLASWTIVRIFLGRLQKAPVTIRSSLLKCEHPIAHRISQNTVIAQPCTRLIVR